MSEWGFGLGDRCPHGMSLLNELVGVMRWLQVTRALSGLTSENPSVATPTIQKITHLNNVTGQEYSGFINIREHHFPYLIAFKGGCINS